MEPGARPAKARAATIAKASRYLAHRFPGLAGAPLDRAKTCHYSITADMGFICDRHPEHDGVWLVGGGSGHGFKHGPAFAETAVAAMTGSAEPELRIVIDKAAGGTSLRTAGWSGAGG